MEGHCVCPDPAIDVESDHGCRRCGLPVDFALSKILAAALAQRHDEAELGIPEHARTPLPGGVTLIIERAPLTERSRCGIHGFHGYSTSTGRCVGCDRLLLHLAGQTLLARAVAWARAGAPMHEDVPGVLSALEDAAVAFARAEARVTT